MEYTVYLKSVLALGLVLLIIVIISLVFNRGINKTLLNRFILRNNRYINEEEMVIKKIPVDHKRSILIIESKDVKYLVLLGLENEILLDSIKNHSKSNNDQSSN